MKSSASSSLLLIFCLCFIFYAPVPALCGMYETLCNEAKEDANSCLNLLKHYSKITSAANYLDLSRSILQVALDKSTQAEHYINGKVMKEHPSGAAKQCGTECYGILTSMSLQSALDELVKDPHNLSYDLRTAGSGPPKCEDALEAANITNPAIHSMNIEMSLFCKIGFLATNHLVVEKNHRKLLAN
ncbi:putative pectinesterase inhibitor domain-containing protein [Medicago truncatula]|uniref:Plant invertase/pectin methylesterase inhibitor protein n=1 Tax=Medicago truncatula TaxID=3880 RepID=A0A072ULH1_MEDTR|nr:plant invertase/pectin methylesterase inhibitor protein [Medicago truncatula]RHN61088.1 putative pectinesterase inhibitor domain-containing protein [Medicago truncatula]